MKSIIIFIIILLPFCGYGQSSRPPMYQNMQSEQQMPSNQAQYEYKKPTKRIQFLIKSFYDEMILNPYPKWQMTVEQVIKNDGNHKYIYYLEPMAQDDAEIDVVLSIIKTKFVDAFVVRYVDGKRIN